MENQVLKMRWMKTDGGEDLKILIPATLVPEVLTEAYGQKMAGHFGIRRTKARVQQSPYYWTHIWRDVKAFCASCDVCAKTKIGNKKRRAPLGDYGVGAPLERVGIDIVGPLTTSNRGNRFIIVIGDYWTKWTEAYRGLEAD